MGFPWLLAHSCGALVFRSMRPENGAALIADAGGLELILSSMKAHPGHQELQRLGTRALTHLLRDNETRCEVLVAAQAVVHLLDMMVLHSASASVAKHIFVALEKLATSSSLSRNEIVQRGGVLNIASVMRQHPTDGGLQGEACVVLTGLLAVDEHAGAVAEAGTIPLIVNALRITRLQSWSQGNCARALADLASARSKSKQHRQQIVEAGAVDRLVDIVGSNKAKDLSWTSGEAMAALRYLVDEPHVASAFTSMGGLRVAAQAAANSETYRHSNICSLFHRTIDVGLGVRPDDAKLALAWFAEHCESDGARKEP